MWAPPTPDDDMSAGREQILGRIRAALGDVPAGERPESVPVARRYRTGGDHRPGAPELIALLAERLRDYHAEVREVPAGDIGRAVTEACAATGLRRVAGPPALPAAWRPAGAEVVEDRGLSAHELDAIDGAITGCAVAVAQTGTLILDGGERSGRRLLTLVPDHHLCVVGAEQVVELVPEAIAALDAAVTGHGVPVTLVSGPSASSDIELSRVEGVHGPRHLLVIIAT
jgi:L-lactate dehydrogenase complex protein LldG